MTAGFLTAALAAGAFAFAGALAFGAAFGFAAALAGLATTSVIVGTTTGVALTASTLVSATTGAGTDAGPKIFFRNENMFFSLQYYLDVYLARDIFLNKIMVLTNLSLSELMDLPLPSVHVQKRLPFRPSRCFVHYAYELINYEVFDNTMYKPKLEVQSHCQKYWGMCMGEVRKNYTGSFCTIRMMDKWFCPQWFITTLAHEMVHQYQWDVLGPQRELEGKDWLMSHGPSFYAFREDLEPHNISLKTAHSQRRWFKYQDLFRA